MIMWGVAKQDVKRVQLITGKGEIFRVMTERLIYQARMHMLHEGVPVNFSMLLWALGTINYHPGMVLTLTAFLLRCSWEGILTGYYSAAPPAEHQAHKL